jgi:hypothetical protein
MSTSTNNGNTWSAPVQIKSTWATDVATDDYPRLGTATGAFGVWIAAWETQDAVYGNQPPVSDANEILYTRTFAPGLDHFLSYRINNPQPISVTLDDVLDTGTYTSPKAVRFLVPADKKNEGMTDPVTHLTGYKLTGPYTPYSGIAAVNQFGSFSLETRASVMLLVPTAKTMPPAAPPTAEPITPVDHYRCVKARLTSGSFNPPNAQANAVDQFGTRKLTVKKPKVLCVATDKNGEGIDTPDQHLLCHPVKPKQPHLVTGAQTIDQFGSRIVDPRKERELCVPTSIYVP